MPRLRILAFITILALLSTCALGATRPNVVLITIDSARADRMGFLGGKGAGTPNLDRLAAESLVFERAYAQAPTTTVSHATILSGVYPQSTGVSAVGGALATPLPSLPDTLRSQGYATAAFVGTIDLDPVAGLAQGFDRGFQTYNAGFRPALPGDKTVPIVDRRAELVATRAIAWIGQHAKGPFFVWLNFHDPRAPAFTYNASLTAADAAAGKILGALKQQNLVGSTAVIVAGSHGESLSSHGEETHGIFLYEESVRVPLVVKLPANQPAPKRVAARVRLIDIAPTVLEIAGIPVPSQMQGQSLLRTAKSNSGDQPVFSRSDLPQRGFGWSALESWRVGKYLYIRAPKPELYDLTADPGATRNLAQSNKATLDTLAAQLESFDRRFSGDAGKSSSGELSSSEMQKLASLGYVGLQKSPSASAAATGTDPKDKIATANKIIDAVSAAQQGKSDRALAAAQPVVSSDSNLFLAEYSLGVGLAQKQQYAEAVKHLHKAIELQPDSAWTHLWIGSSLLKSGDAKSAVIHLEIAAGRLNAFGPVHAELASAYEKVGRTEEGKKERGKEHRQ